MVKATNSSKGLLPLQDKSHPSEPIRHQDSLKVEEQTSQKEVLLLLYWRVYTQMLCFDVLSCLYCAMRVAQGMRRWSRRKKQWEHQKKTKKIKIASYNVNGVLNPIKRTRILNKMKRELNNIISRKLTEMMTELGET